MYHADPANCFIVHDSMKLPPQVANGFDIEIPAATRYEVLEYGMFMPDPKEPYAHGNGGTIVDTILEVV